MSSNYDNFLIVLGGPSGTGKDAVIQELLKCDTNLVRAVSVTSREKRPGEQEGVDYFFKTKEEFERMIATGEILEYGRDYENYYGTLTGFLPLEMRKDKDIIKVIELKGLQQLRQKLSPREFISIYMLPPSLAEVQRRLNARGRDDSTSIQKRMGTVKQKISEYSEYEFVIVNDILENTVQEVLKIINFSRQQRQQYYKMKMLAEKLLQEEVKL